MRHTPSEPAKDLQTFSEPFWAGFGLSNISKLPEHSGLKIAALCLSTLFLSMAARAEMQLQRLYTAPNTSNRPSFILQANDGNFYGTIGNASQGYVFKMTPSGAVTNFPLIVGLNPEIALGDDGNIYGSANTPTFGGNTNGYIFKMTPAGQFTIAFAFDGTNGARPTGMRKGIDGCFYGVMGRTNSVRFLFPPSTNHADVFQFTTNNTVTKLYSVTNGTLGTDFTGLPVQGPDGYLYGTMFSDSGHIVSPLFSPYVVRFYRLSTNGDFQIICTRTNASAPAGDLIFGPDGLLYGTISTDVRGYPTVKAGSIFRITTNGVFSSLFSFGTTNGTDPEARLLSASDGNLYGSTFSGGSNNRGTLYSITVHGEFTSLLDFTGANGSNPTGPLVQGADGNLYGVTESSTITNIGTIYRLVQSTAITNFGASNGTATLTWNSFPNGIYRVEYKSVLSDLSWVPLIQRVTATDQTITVFDNAATDPQRLYRVVLLP
jgi:uncharacterized repeat protein (TIGR03803 family)